MKKLLTVLLLLPIALLYGSDAQWSDEPDVWPSPQDNPVAIREKYTRGNKAIGSKLIDVRLLFNEHDISDERKPLSELGLRFSKDLVFRTVYPKDEIYEPEDEEKS